MNKKGQALVEFVILMPVFIFIMLAIFDFGNILYKRYTLESELDTVVSLYNESNTLDVERFVNSIGAKVKYEENDMSNKITLSKKVNVITPIVSNIIGKNYEINTSRTVIKQKDEEEEDE